jgi:hypothetical protein
VTVVALVLAAAVSFGVGSTWLYTHVERPISKLCGGSCTGIPSSLGLVGPAAVALVALGLLVALVVFRVAGKASGRDRAVAVWSTVLITIALSSGAVLLQDLGVFGFPSGDAICMVRPDGSCRGPEVASAAWPIAGVVLTVLAAVTAGAGRR